MCSAAKTASEISGIDGGRLSVVLGAGGGTGGAIVRELVGQGRRVRAVTRGGNAAASYGTLPPASFEDVAADVTAREQLRPALDGAAVVYHCAQPAYTRRPQELPAMTRGIMEATAAAGAKLVFADNLSMYGPVDGAMTEDTPPVAQTKKGKVRAAMAAELLEADREGRLHVVIGRSSDYFGPGGLTSAIGERFFKALLAGKKVTWLADLDQPHTMSYLPDMARAFILLGERPEADGHVWHTPAAEALTGRQFIELAARLAGTPARPALMGPGTVRLVGLFTPVLRELPERMEQWQRPFVMDAGKFAAAFGPFAVTPPEDALRTTLEWFRGCV
ncbi:MAG: NAD-dependent epimerase/dehydratase family protein [Actinobacteria bacterium]|nr:NAD-dependent epimerase/dehydratase family protein [Actinomycetota bacterium]